MTMQDLLGLAHHLARYGGLVVNALLQHGRRQDSIGQGKVKMNFNFKMIRKKQIFAGAQDDKARAGLWSLPRSCSRCMGIPHSARNDNFQGESPIVYIGQQTYNRDALWLLP